MKSPISILAVLIAVVVAMLFTASANAQCFQSAPSCQSSCAQCVSQSVAASLPNESLSKTQIKFEDGVVLKGNVVVRVGWPKAGESFVEGAGVVSVATSDHDPAASVPRVIVRKAWTAPVWLDADFVRMMSGKLHSRKEGDEAWYEMDGINIDALNLPADWDGSPMRCNPEAS